MSAPKGSGNSEKFVLRIGTAKQTPKNQTYNQASVYGELLQMQMQLTEYLKDMTADRYDLLTANGYKLINVSSSPALLELQKFIDGDFAVDGAEDNVVAEEDGQFYEVSPPKDGKKKKKKKN